MEKLGDKEGLAGCCVESESSFGCSELGRLEMTRGQGAEQGRAPLTRECAAVRHCAASYQMSSESCRRL
eukprot:6201617-Pleurochrysis_carterae.AAC.1